MTYEDLGSLLRMVSRVTSPHLSDGARLASSANCVCPWQRGIVTGVGELMRTVERLSKQEGPV